MARVIAVEPQAQGLGQRTTEQTTEVRTEDITSRELARQETAIKEGQRILRETSSSVSSARQQAAASESKGGGGLTGIVDVGIQLADRFASIKGRQLETQRKQAEAREEALRKQAEAELEARRQQQLTEVESIANDIILKQGENGTFQTQYGLRAVINDPKFADITDEDKRELERRYQSAIRRTQDDIIQKVERQEDEHNRAKLKAVEAQTIRLVGGQLSQLKYTADPTKQTALVEQMLEQAEAQAANANLTPLDRLALRTSILEVAARNESIGREALLDINQKREQLTAATAAVAAADTAYANGQISYDTRQQLINDALAKNPGASGFKLPTVEDAQNEAIRIATFNKKLRDLSKEQYEFENALPVLENQAIAELALEVVTDPSMRAKFEVYDTADNRRVLDTADYLEDIRGRLADPARKKELASSAEQMRIAQAELESMNYYINSPEEWARAKEAGIPVPDISPEAMAAQEAKYTAARDRYGVITQSIQYDLGALAKYGVVYDSNTGTLGLNGNVSGERARIEQTPTTSSSSSEGGGETFVGRGTEGFDPNEPFAGFGVGPGFNQAGGSPGQSFQPMSKSMTGTSGTVKLVAPVSSVYKGHFIDNSPVGSYDFTLIDKNDSVVTALPSPVTGEVTESRWVQGYGNVIAVYDPTTGHEWFMAHLAQPGAPVGSRVVAGQKIGVQGSTGNSTGEHVHLEILQGKWAEGGQRITNRAITKPLVTAYLNRAMNGKWPTTTPASLGLPPNQNQVRLPHPYRTGRVPTYTPPTEVTVPPGAMALPGGGYILGSQLYLPQVARSNTNPLQPIPFNNQRPLTMPSASRYREDYPDRNDPESNYGYETLRSDTAFRHAVAGVADRLDIPAQWLADIMAFESTQNGIIHNPAAMNSQGAVGLIQFYPGGGLAEVAQEMGVSESEASQRLRSMSRAQQMKWVEFHLRKQLQYAGKERYERMDDVFSAVFGGAGLLRKSDAERQSVGDGSISYTDYRARVGEIVGRSYSTQRGGRATHTSVHRNCPTCNSMMKTQGTITPHQAP